MNEPATTPDLDTETQPDAGAPEEEAEGKATGGSDATGADDASPPAETPSVGSADGSTSDADAPPELEPGVVDPRWSPPSKP